MTAFASVADLQRGWRSLSAVEQGIAEELIVRADAAVRKELSDAGIDPESVSGLLLVNCMTVVCDMVRYSFVSGSLGNSSALGDGFDGVWSGDMEGGGILVTDAHRGLLGIGGAGISSVRIGR